MSAPRAKAAAAAAPTPGKLLRRLQRALHKLRARGGTSAAWHLAGRAELAVELLAEVYQRELSALAVELCEELDQAVVALREWSVRLSGERELLIYRGGDELEARRLYRILVASGVPLSLELRCNGQLELDPEAARASASCPSPEVSQVWADEIDPLTLAVSPAANSSPSPRRVRAR